MPSSSSSSTSSFSSSSSSLILLVVLFAASVSVELVNAQMTFSDGWGKRSAAMSPFALIANRHHGTAPSKRQHADSSSRAVSDLFVNTDEDVLNPAMEACHVGYAQRLVQLHEQMLNLFNSYQQCQTKAAMLTMNGEQIKKATKS